MFFYYAIQKEYFIKQKKAELAVKQKLKRKEEQAMKKGSESFERKQLFSKATGESSFASEFASALTTKSSTKKSKKSAMPFWKKGGKRKGAPQSNSGNKKRKI